MLYYLYSLLFFLPFERIPSFQFAGVTIRITVILLIAGFIFLLPIIIKKRQFLPLSTLDKTIFIFSAIAIASNLFADHHARSAKVLVFLAATILGYVLTSRILRQKFSSLNILRAVTISGTITALFGLYQFIGDAFGLSLSWTGLASQYSKIVFGFPRVQSVGLEPLYYANFLLLPLFLLTAFLIFEKRKPRWYELGSLTVMLTAFFLALSRGAYAAAIGATFIAIIALWIKKIKPRNTGFIALCIGCALLFSFLGIQLTAGSKGIATFSSHAIVDNGASKAASVTPRLVNYSEAWRLFLTKPILGIGIGNYGVVNTVSPPADGHYMIVNNQYLETLAEMGIIGLIGLLLIIIAVFMSLKKLLELPNPWLGFALGATIIGIGIQYNFLSTIYILFLWVVLGITEAASFRATLNEPLECLPESLAKE